MKWFKFFIGFNLPIMVFVLWWILEGSYFAAFQKIGETIVSIRPWYTAYGLWVAFALLPLGFFMASAYLEPRLFEMGKISSGFMIGFVFGWALIFWILDNQFFMGAVQFFPYTLGCLILVPSLNYAHGWYVNRSKSNMVKAVLAGGLLLMLLVPAIGARVAPAPENGLTSTPFGEFEVERVQVVNSFNLTLRNLAIPENSGNKWFTYVYFPSPFPTKVPLFIFLHGLGGTNPKYYDNMMRQVSSRGLLGIYVQYPTEFKEEIVSFADIEYPFLRNESKIIKENPYRYRIVWEGIETLIDDLLDGDSGLQVDSTNIDFDRILISGHSLGGGMVPYITTKVLEKGWGQESLILNIEAGWVDTLSGNLTRLPSKS